MGSPSRGGEVVEQEGKRYKIVEFQIDGNNTVLRRLVPFDTTEEDIPEHATLLDEDETRGLMTRSSKPEKILPSDAVRLRDLDSVKTGTVMSKLRSGKFDILWEDNTRSKHEASELYKVH